MASVFALVDCNNFYVSCERVFNPKLVGRPVVVLSNNDGCVISRSEEAKRLGITMGAPLFKVRHLIEAHNVAVHSSNYVLYGDMSQRVMGALQELTPEVEVYSIDEAFVDLEGCRYSSLPKFGAEVRQKIRRWTGLPVSVGIARTKTLAKIANRVAKQSPAADGVLDLTESSHQARVLAETPVGDVWGIGPSRAKHLSGAGVTTALELRDADRRWVRGRMGVVGARIVEELRGLSCLPLERCPPPKRSLVCSRSFAVLVESLADLREAVAVYTTRAAEKLRRAGLAANVVSVFIQTDRFSTEQRYYNAVTHELAHPTDTTQELIEWTLRGVEQVFYPGYKYKKAGVMLSGLVASDRLSMRLFGQQRWERSRRLMSAVDGINARHGRDRVRLGVARPDGRWKTEFGHRSARYTTRLEEVLRVP